MHAFAPKSKGPLASALRALARFAMAFPCLRLFDNTLGRDAVRQRVRNEWIFILFIQHLLETKSEKTGKPLRVNTIVSYVSLTKGFLSHKYGFELVEDGPRLRRIIKDLRESDVTAGLRKKRRGWRKHHFERLVRRQPEVRGSQQDLDALNEFAAASTSWQVLARGGEITNSAPGRWRAEVDPTRADLAFHTRANGERYAILMLRPLKKRGTAPQAKISQYIAEHDGGPTDTYTALRRLVEMDPVEREERVHTPLFRLRKGAPAGQPRAMRVTDYRALIQRFARIIGYLDARQWGAHSTRIGGATDLASTGKCSQALLAAKGRWASDVGNIYARMTRHSQLEASRLMQKARGRDLEELLPDFTQAA